MRIWGLKFHMMQAKEILKNFKRGRLVERVCRPIGIFIANYKKFEVFCNLRKISKRSVKWLSVIIWMDQILTPHKGHSSKHQEFVLIGQFGYFSQITKILSYFVIYEKSANSQ